MISSDPILRFVTLFDRGEFYGAHEELAAPWRANKSILYKALIQTAAAFLHLQKGNDAGAARLLNRASNNLRQLGDRPCFLDVMRLCATLDRLSPTVRSAAAAYAFRTLRLSEFLGAEETDMAP